MSGFAKNCKLWEHNGRSLPAASVADQKPRRVLKHSAASSILAARHADECEKRRPRTESTIIAHYSRHNGQMPIASSSAPAHPRDHRRDEGDSKRDQNPNPGAHFNAFADSNIGV